MPTIVCVSDTHGRHADTVVSDGDILVHAGDLTLDGTVEGVGRFDAWLSTLPHRHKVVIAGNHDWCFQRWPAAARAALRHAVYLEDEAVILEGLKFYGSPWQPWFFDWAFNLERGAALAAKWAMIPADTDVLMTHGPPTGLLDRTNRGSHPGCDDLLQRVREVRPKLHVFGHIHEAAGVVRAGDTLFVNASTQMGKGAGVVVRLDPGGEAEVVGG